MSGTWVRTALRWHALVFVLLNALVATINFVFTPDTWWFLWVTGTWGIALVLHAFGALSSDARPAARDDTEDDDDDAKTRRRGGSRRRRRSRRAEQDSDAPTLRAMGLAETQLHASSPSDHAVTEVAHAPLSSGTRSARTPTLSPGQKIAGRFTVERALGAGGMGEVYVAHDALLDETVALKTIAASLVGQDAIERFFREAQAARRISHPNVVRIHDIGRDGELTFISMEYVRGETLTQWLMRAGLADVDALKPIALQLCAALAAAHDAGVIHRDLKPDNVLIDGRGQVRVIDFGLARVESNDGLTTTGTVMGTPTFMAPEQMLAQPVDARTDIYALGCVLHFALVGKPPFTAETPVAVGVAHVHERASSLLPARPDLPAAWDALVLRALEKSPDQRFQSANELAQAIAAL